ncbi:endonuclease/exonuclease/phosphatase family protein, partial [Streptosporangium fragile]|uniref:endonuclease/exonuclease/phosphatase family protein n=1 Tax=Streptosporangium fragile TaxID=46186 RepID=UPI0031E80CEE
AGGPGAPGRAPGAARRGAARWTGRAALAVVSAWLLLALVNWLTGRFWWWGGAVPLLPFFAVPLLLLGSVPMLLLARTRLPRLERVLVSLSAAGVALIVLRRLLTGRTWIWVVPDLMVPPLLYALLPAALLATLAVLGLCRISVAVTARRWTALLAVTALGLGLDQAGLTLRMPWDGGDGPAPPGALRVVSWDTYCWNTTDDPGGFFRYLKKWDADVYLLQEHSGCGPGAPVPIEDGELLRREFPAHHVVAADGLLTISRFPVAAQVPLGTNPNPFAPRWVRAALRTDLRIGERPLSVYNVHLYDMLYLSSSPLTPRFHRAIEALDAERRTQFDALAADIDGNPNPVLVSGNLNTLPGMGHLRRLDHLRDAARAGGSPYPATLTFAGLRLWRMDWTLTSHDVRVHRYDLRSPEGMSSHHLQDMVVSLSADEGAAPPPRRNPDPKEG